MVLESLETVDEIMDFFGGNQGMMELTGCKSSTVSMWRTAKRFPTNTYLVIAGALKERGKTAPPALWSMK